jgi:predicted NACHT family NTPase/transcriptional regulator with XRE-family HTH domain
MGLQATAAGIEQAKVALKGMQLNQDKLAKRLDVTRQPIGKFFRGEIVGDENFVRICEILGLDWKTIAGVVGPQTPNTGGFETGSAPPELGAGGPPGIDAIVQQVRSAVRPLIQEQCGTMRVLDMDQPIELTGDRGIYTNVNILEKQSRLRSERELLEDCDFDNRLVREKGIPGLKAVEEHRRLMVLGKPGAGKTTFLKYLAMQCITGGFAADKVPFFVTLKDFAETDDRPSLVDYLSRSIGGGAKHSGEESSASPTNHLPNASPLLLAGRSLVLLDGLDEVRKEDTKRIIREMRDTADRYGKSQFVITCRIAAKEYTFERFTEVEVADFNAQQITTFAEKWFRAKNDFPKAKQFVKRLRQNQPIQELATTPILLTLLCLVFGIEGDFPKNRLDLYENGIEVLLKRWDESRDVEREQIYKNLDWQLKADFLSHLALPTFVRSEYFIPQRRMRNYVSESIESLHKNHVDLEFARMDSDAVLSAIQAQHGLLVERARGIYSFSHLTFQEYFAARGIALTNQLNMLIPNITEKRWREVFLLVSEIMENADELLTSMKSHIDLMFGKDQELQQFLQWVSQKSSSVIAPYKSAAVRAFYFAIARAQDLELAQELDLARSLDLVRARSLVSDLALDRALALDLVNGSVRARANDLASTQDAKLNRDLQKVRDLLPDTSQENRENFKKWWQTNGKKWTEDLRQITITHRNIGHDWQFTDDQKALLQQYYDANLFLVECLNSDCYVSRSVREEIEATLLLPVGEIEN